MEMNASDTRSKKTLQQYITEVLSNKTMDHSLSGTLLLIVVTRLKYISLGSPFQVSSY